MVPLSQVSGFNEIAAMGLLRSACIALLGTAAWLAAGCNQGSSPPATTSAVAAAPGDPLPSWNQGASRQAILDFVAQVTLDGGPGYVPPDERIAVFDNDGTLWSEKPLPFQLLFALDQVRAMAAAAASAWAPL